MRLAIISDIHEDLPGLKKILSRLNRKGYDQLICLGDISGFSSDHYRYNQERDAPACLQLLREKCTIILAGNHDLHAAKKSPQHSDIFNFPHNWYELSPEERGEMTGEEIWLHLDDLNPGYSPVETEFLSTLPEYEILDAGDYRILLSHYAFPNLSGFKKGFYSKKKEFVPHFDFMQKKDCLLGITGHTHLRRFYVVRPDRFKHYRYRKAGIPEFPAIVGVPPVTRHNHRSGFCIFDTITRSIRVYL